MICINCFEPSTCVINSRPRAKQASVWRRRRCRACEVVFTTTEAPLVGDALEIIYGDGSSESFSLPRLTVSFAGLLTHHKEKAADEGYWLSQTVYQILIERGNGGQAIPLHEFVTTAHKVLERFDALAGLQYAAQHGLVTNTRKSPGRPRLSRRA